ncbi:MAG TPA: DNA polymerase III subunit beta [Pyrinomonadaceae bacterium]|nr:DNA polymerase III subunit beta [Pyrinomonadaceae bacterium]
MEFVIKQSVLKDELGFVQGIVEKKSTIPVLSNILIESVGENNIRIVGTDLDVTIRCEAAADIKQAGSMCLQARKLFDIVRLLPDADVHFTKDENEWVKLSCGKSNFRLAGVNREQFPEVPSFKSAPMKLSAEIFNHFIHNTAFAITNEQSRFTLSGAKFMIDGAMARMVTTDGHRLAFIEKQLTGNADTGTMDALIPKKALMELTKIARDSSGEVSFGEDENHIYFEVGGRLLITRKLSGSFPNYEMVIPKDNDKVAVFDAEEMKNAIRRVALMADERTRSVRITIKSNEIEIGAQSSEEGEANEKIAAEYSGEEINIGFNSQYLQEFLNVVGSGESESGEATEKENDGETVRVKETANRLRIAFEFKDGNAQTQLNIAGDKNYDYKYIVMPLRI